MKNALTGRNALITGATGGIGRAIALDLAGHGVNLLLSGRDSTLLTELQRDISREHRVQCEIQAADLSCESDVVALAASAREKLQGIDTLIHSAGVFSVGEVESLSMDDLDSSYQIHLRAPVLLTKLLIRDLAKNQRGRVVFIGSSSAYQGFANTPVYCAMKHALLGFARSLHARMKSRGARVYCVSPGGVKTRMGKQVSWENYDSFMDPAEVAEYVSFIIGFQGELISEEIRLNRISAP